jgi:hypothetical protein
MLDADDTSRAETERRRALFAWADRVLAEIGLAAHIAQADLHELANVVFDAEAAAIAIAIAAALHPTGGGKVADHFRGLSGKMLKRILASRFSEIKRAREAELAVRGASSRSYPADQDAPNPANLVGTVLGTYVELTVHQLAATTLWILHSHIFDRFMVSPRLAVLSPVRGCGKSLLLDIASRLVAKGRMAGSITAAAIYHVTDAEHPTLLLDEADNLDTAADKLLKAVLNDGYRRGVPRTHMTRNGLRDFDIYAPMALAAIGTLPLPLLHRSILIEMKRATRPRKRFDSADIVTQLELSGVFRDVSQWARNVVLASDPLLPPGLVNRPADNWRPLIAVADSVGGEWPELAQAAAVALSKDRLDEDPGVMLLTDIRGIFDRRRIDRLPSITLVEDLVAIEDGMWSVWRGVKDEQQPRRLTQGELARLLRPFGIRPRTVWPAPRDRSAQGYYRTQFKASWAAYCPEANTATQTSKIRWLAHQ